VSYIAVVPVFRFVLLSSPSKCEGRPESRERLRIALAQVNAPASSIQHPVLAPSDFHLFPTLQKFWGGRRFKSNEEVKDAVKKLLVGLASEVYDEGIQKLITG
jgi:hypothetical protein